MSQIRNEIEQYFNSSLKRGEQRKILYLYDQAKEHEQELKNLSNESSLFRILEVHDSNYIYTNYLIEKKHLRENLFLYFTMERPKDEENPLLDVLLYSSELKMDSQSQLSQELGLDVDSSEYADLLATYSVFFNAKERRKRFSRIFSKSLRKDSNDFEMSIYASICRVNQADWIDVFISLFEEIISKQSTTWENIKKFGNEGRFWKIVGSTFGYHEDAPSIDHLVESLFVTHLEDEIEGEIPDNLAKHTLQAKNGSIIFINQWMNQRYNRDSYIQSAKVIEENLNIKELFEEYPLKDLAKSETFGWFDTFIVEAIATELNEKNPDLDFYESLIFKRRNTFWYQDFRSEYHLLVWAIRLLHQLAEINLLQLNSIDSMWKAYEERFFKIDQAYRKFYFYFDQLKQDSEVFRELRDFIEQKYLKQFIMKFADKWDVNIENSETVKSAKQADFYETRIHPFISQDKKVFVVISDGLRFEAGEELFRRLTSSHRFSGELTAMQTFLPSNTAVGMAALLPHEKITILEDGNVLVDGRKSISTESRNLILQHHLPEKSLAIHYNDMMQKNRDELRRAFAGKRLIYIYHNQIDAIGDQPKMENRIFDAVEDTLQQLQRLLTRLATEVSATQIYMTADHGFLYQRSLVNTTQKVKMDLAQSNIVRNKRFILSEDEISDIEGINKSLSGSSIYKNIAFPRGINRFTFSGGGYQYVHGGHLPQETMIPLMDLKVTRSAKETNQVDVTLLNQNRMITHNVVWLNFLQTNPVSDQRKEKHLSIYFEDEKGLPISNEVMLIAGSSNQTNEKRIYEKKFVILNRDFESFEKCYLIMKNIEDSNDIQKEAFEIDLVK